MHSGAHCRTELPPWYRAIRALSVVRPIKRGAAMPSAYTIDRNRGTKEGRQQLAALRDRWPLAFPAKDEGIRPLGVGASREIAEAMGWSLPYTLGVLDHWKMPPAYCEAVLRYDQRINLDGTPAEPLDAQAKDLATKRLAQLAARKVPKNAATATEPATVKAKPAATSASGKPRERPEQLRDRVRASLLRRRGYASSRQT
jgi:sRNA-binding protein